MADVISFMTDLYNETGAVEDAGDWCHANTTHQECVAHGNGGALDTGNTPCHRVGIWALCNICQLPDATYYGSSNVTFSSYWDTLWGHEPTGLPYDENPEGFALLLIKAAHLMPFLTGIAYMCMIAYRMETLQSRIGNFGILCLNLSLMGLAIGDMVEWASHDLLQEWNMCYDSSSSTIFLFFYIFNGGGCALWAIGLRKKGTSFFRKFTFSLDGLSLLVDWLFIVFILLIPVAWYNPYGWTFPFRFFNGTELNHYRGRTVAGSVFVKIASLTSFAQVGRIFTNLGPTDRFDGKYLLLSMAAAFLPLVGVAVDTVMVKSPYQLLHSVLAFSFGASQLCMTYAIFLAVPATKPAASIGEREHLI